MEDIRPGSTPTLPDSLTSREREILVCLCEGLSNQEIANRLYLAEKTVRWYNTQIYSKLGVGSRQEAIERAKALGLLDVVSAAPPVAGKHNLPAQTTPFVGRRDELSELAVLLNDPNTRLITILAPGGMGKTRVALEAARMQIGRYADGVYFVPLAPLSDANDIVTTIAEIIGFSFFGKDTPAQQLVGFLSERSMLLVLDNFEHLLDGAPLVSELVQAGLGMRVLTTTRERLNLRGETVYTLRGLEFPTWETPEDALDYEAVKLFLQSARRVRPDFILQPDDLGYMARICRLTAGMPLGIELAAGWVDVLSLEQIAAEIQRGIDILETEMRDVPERQRSVRATFEQTWERLNDEEQRVFMRLSVFRGGFTVEAAKVVADADIRSLRKLATKALVQAALGDRHDIHELLRQFAAEKLAISGQQSQIQPKHADFFADFMSDRKPDFKTNRQLEALALIDADFENVRVAWLHTVNRQDWDHLPKFLHSLWFYLDVRTRGQEAVALLEHAVKALQSSPSTDVTELALGRVLARLGWFYNDIGFSERGAVTSDEAIRILRQHNSPDDLIAALHERQNVANFIRQLDVAVSVSQEGLNIARSIGDKSWEGRFLFAMGQANETNANAASALQFFEGALAIFQELEDRWGLMLAYSLLGWINETQQAYEAANQWLHQALIEAEAFGHVFSIGNNNTALGIVALDERNYAAARLYLRKALHVHWAGYKSVMVPFPLVHIARMLAQQNNVDRAVEILAVIQKYPLSFGDTDAFAQALRDEMQAELEPERFAAVWTHGQRQELSALVAELLAEFADE